MLAVSDAGSIPVGFMLPHKTTVQNPAGKEEAEVLQQHSIPIIPIR
jgi:hypothetical protein